MTMPLSPRFYRIAVAALLIGSFVASCGGSSATSQLTAVAADSGVKPNENGFSFANFGSAATSENFNSADLVTMFGASACVGGNTTTCEPTAQAAAWAKMVNESRASGHCEGLAVQAASRFDAKASPATVTLANKGDVTHGIIRAFATQFLPEVQDATDAWAKKSLVDIVNELSTSFTNKSVSYTMGLYTPHGGHAVLPYALEFPKPNLAVVKVYDSNWPGMERFVVIDLDAQVWYFSFSGENPQDDPCAWSGKAGDMDITPMDARTSATCPFCGDGTKVTKSVLLIRSTSLNWSVKTQNGTYSPSSTDVVTDVNAKSLRSTSCDTEVKIPEFVLYTDSEDFELELPDTSSAYVSNGNSVVQIATTGSKNRKPIHFKKNTISVEDPSTTLTVSSDNVVAQVTSNVANINVGESLVSIDVGGSSAPITASASTPQIVVSSVGESAPVVTQVTDLVSVVPPVVVALTPPEVKAGLSAASARDLTNSTYAAFVDNTPVTPVTAPPMTTSSTSTTVTAKTSPLSKATTTTAKSTSSTGGSVATSPSSNNDTQSDASTATTTTTKSSSSTASPTTTTATSSSGTNAPPSATTTTVRTTTTTTAAPTTTVASPTTTALVDISSVRVITSPNARNSTSITVRVYSNHGSTPGHTDYSGPFVLVGECVGTNCADKTFPWPIGYGWYVTISGCPSWSGLWESHFPAFSYGLHNTNDQSTCDP